METLNIKTPEVKKVPAEPRAPVLQPLVYKSVVTVYRIFAILTLYIVLAGVLAYGFVMGFYALNTSWAAPVILSPADDKSLDFTEKLVTSRQTLEDLNVDEKRLGTESLKCRSIGRDCSRLNPNCRPPSRGKNSTI